MIRKLLITSLGAAVIGAVVWRHRNARIVALMPKPIVATQPTSQPIARRAVKPKYPSYLELVRSENPAVAATQPLDFPLELADSAHLILHDPVYLDPTGNLWITRPDGQPTAKALIEPDQSEDHIIRDRPVFVHWFTDEIGNWAAAVVVPNPTGGGYDIITKAQRLHLATGRNFNWSSAFSVVGKIVVSTDVGVSVLDIGPTIQEHDHVLPGMGAGCNPPVALLDTRGLLAWSPWEKGRPGSAGVCRFVDGQWTDLPASDWPARPIQLSMLLDGSVLCIGAGVPAATAPAVPSEGVVETDLPDQFADQVHLSIAQLDPTQLDEKQIGDLINQLSDTDSDQRLAAFNELSRYGPAIAPLLEKAGDDQLPEAKVRIQQLLRNKLTPALGGLIPVDNRLDVAGRCGDGTVIFFAPSGVQIPTEREEPDLVNPAWLALRADGRMERPLPPALIRDQNPSAPTLLSLQDEWVVSDDAGPRRLVGNQFQPLLGSSEKQFNQIVGLATHRRWVFRDSTGDTLIIDPLVADPTPKLPTWTIMAGKVMAGWAADNLPAVSRADQTGNWELDADGWKPLPPPQKLITELVPATRPASTLPTVNPLLTSADGTEYFDGKNSITMLKPSGEKIVWPLPGTAVGTSDPTLMLTDDGLLFLFNQPGRLLRIRPTPGASEPFKLEAVFTKDIPDEDHPRRIWLDPAGRIDFVTSDQAIVVTFPQGHIPKEISRMMLEDQP